ncbi:MAG TPA: o-succinylbenzoate synthase [Balneolaceae bacterium]|nr:o-succinylbenzoate synthase [Balneolaceae bacterium]
MKLSFYTYRLPFSSPFITSKATFRFREGVILEYRGDEFTCYGEAAPLPGFSAETLPDIRQNITQKKSEFKAVFESEAPVEALQKLYQKSQIPASLQFGLDSLAYQIEAHHAGTNLRGFLFENAPQKIPVNAVVSLHADKYLSKVEQFMAEGFQTIKFKTGLNFDLEFERLKEVRAQFPSLSIRLDANQAWPVDDAIRHLSKLQKLDIEYCEEPLSRPNADTYSKLKRETDIPLALDESLTQQADWHSMLPFVSVLVLKPMLLGSFTKIFVTKRFGDAHDSKIVLTSALESGVGRMITSVLATGLGSQNVAQGLNTSRFFATDVYSDRSHIHNGMYDLSYYQKWITIQLNNQPITVIE